MKSAMLEASKIVVISFSLFYTCLDIFNNLFGLSSITFFSHIGMAFFYSFAMMAMVFTIRKMKRCSEKKI